MRIDNSGHLLVGKTSGTSGNKVETDGRVSAGAGSNSQPTFNCEGDTNTGINLPESDRIQFITGGTERLRIDANGTLQVGSYGTYAAGAAVLHLHQSDATSNAYLHITQELSLIHISEPTRPY